MTRGAAAVAIWRVATETRAYPAQDLSGAGAAKYPGRWNDQDQLVLYAADCPALAMLETLAHLGTTGFPMNRFLVRIEIPAATWTRRKALAPEDLPATWAAIPAGVGSVLPGAEWLRAGAGAVLTVPSVITPEHQVILINPRHPDARRVQARVMRRVDFGHALRV
jgi:RES domain-containing protein